ncbi:MAG: hypothetical protein ACQEXX_24255 [Bacillota bacterium]
MKYLKFFTFIATLILIISGCTPDNDLPIIPKEQAAEKINVELSINENFDKDGRLQISGVTNLPSELELMLTVSNQKGYKGQTKVCVENGMFESEWFSDHNQELPDDKYIIRVTSPSANVQPENVKEIIGEEGANLFGEFVKEDNVWGKMIDFSYSFSKGEMSDTTRTSTTTPTTTPTTSRADEEIWGKVYEYLETGEYNRLAEEIEKLPNPSDDLQMMYYFSMHHVYGQGGEDEKSLESLYKIPKDYSGRNADLISYNKYIYEFFEAGRKTINFDDYVEKYLSGKVNQDSYYVYRQNQSKTQDESYVEETPFDNNNPREGTFGKQEDYNMYGEYKPVENMIQEEIQAELEEILEQSLSND